MAHAVLAVKGMTCQHCAGRVSVALAAVAGVTDVAVDLDGGCATFEATDAAVVAAARDAVIAAGYEVPHAG